MMESYIKANEADAQKRENPEVYSDEPESDARTRRDRSENLRKWLIRLGVLAAIVLLLAVAMARACCSMHCARKTSSS